MLSLASQHILILNRQYVTILINLEVFKCMMSVLATNFPDTRVDTR